MKKNKYSISDLERFTSIKAHTIRMWENRFKIFTPERSVGNVRSYKDEDLRKLLNISLLLKKKFKISKIATLTNEELNEKVIGLSSIKNNDEYQIDNLLESMMEFDEQKFDKIIASSSINIGFENTVINIIYPFFEKIGILWLAGRINPAYEHYMTNLLRQKLIVAIDGQMPNQKPDAKKFLLFLPENEWHELGLLFYSYILKKNGHSIVYLGQSVPLNELQEITPIINPDAVVTSFTTVFSDREFDSYIQRLSLLYPSTTVFITGLQVISFNPSLPPNFIKISSLSRFKEKIASI